MNLSDAQAVERFLDGDQEGFRVIVDRYRNRVLTYLSRYYKLADRAQDATQETFFRLFRKMTRVSGFALQAETLGSIILTIAARSAIDVLRRETKRRQKENELVLFPVADPVRAEAEAMITELELDVRAAMAKLSPALRQVTLLYFVEGHTGAAIALITQLSTAAVWSRIRRARELLTGNLKDYGKGGDDDARCTSSGRAGKASDGGVP